MDKKWLDDYAEKFKALGHPVRLKLVLGLMYNEECNVSKICDGLNIPQATTSQHLAILKSKGILECERRGTMVCYRVVDEAIKIVLKKLMEVTHTEFEC